MPLKKHKRGSAVTVLFTSLTRAVFILSDEGIPYCFLKNRAGAIQ